MVKNTAFVFIKPHANTEKARAVVKEEFTKRSINVVKEGLIDGTEIESKMLIDNHYYAIASKATILKPDALNVPKPMFKEKFGLEWDDALSQKLVFNAKDACTELGVDSEGLNGIWAKAKKAGNLVKFGGGFYCGLLDESLGASKKIYVMNGFFMSMRSNFVAPGASIYYFVVEWEKDTCAWEDFRGKVLGPTDPVTAPADSLRGMFMANWEAYGLAYAPNVGDNAVHASASPFESLAERMNWLGMAADSDDFGKLVLSVLDAPTLDEWSKDPAVTYGVLPIKKSVFDSVEDCDSDYCLALLGMMYAQLATKSKSAIEKQQKSLEEAMAGLKM